MPRDAPEELFNRIAAETADLPNKEAWREIDLRLRAVRNLPTGLARQRVSFLRKYLISQRKHPDAAA